MVAKLTRLTHKIAIQLHLVAESCTICSSRSSQPVRKLLDTTSFYLAVSNELGVCNFSVHEHTYSQYQAVAVLNLLYVTCFIFSIVSFQMALC
jgi:hypothetical protein